MANKREICEKYKVSSGWNLGAFASLQIHHIEYGVDDFIYCSYVYDNNISPSYHKLKIYSTSDSRQYVIFGKSRFYLDESIRV
mgnify:FL=1